MRNRTELELGDIVQIVDKNHHWFPALITVTEPKSFGCKGYMIVVKSNDPDDPNPQAYVRLNHEHFKKVGHAVIIME